MPILRRRLDAFLLAAAILACGATGLPAWPASAHAMSPAQAQGADRTTNPATPWTPVVRYGRYTLVELVPEAAQRDLLLQISDVTIPVASVPTVGGALHYVLMRSGYRLCDDAQVEAQLAPLPLPAAHVHLGPLPLRDLLVTLAGPAWDLHVDDLTREICFVPHPPEARS